MNAANARTITVLCDGKLFDLLEPVEKSRPIPYYDRPVGEYAEYVAVFDEVALARIGEDRVEAAETWWRELAPSNTAVPWDVDRIVGMGGVWPYLCQVIGMSTEKNRALGLFELSFSSGMSQVELANWMADREDGSGVWAEQAEATS